MGFLSLGFALIFFFTNGVYKEIISKPHRDEDPIFNKINQEILMKMSQADQI